jgi:hypothetical protein
MRPEDRVVAPPLKVLLGGHMIDAPGRREPRFPAGKELVAADAIANVGAD